MKKVLLAALCAMSVFLIPVATMAQASDVTISQTDPSGGSIHIQVHGSDFPGKMQVVLITIDGTQVATTEVSPGDETATFDKVPPGTYVAVAYDGDIAVAKTEVVSMK